MPLHRSAIHWDLPVLKSFTIRESMRHKCRAPLIHYIHSLITIHYGEIFSAIFLRSVSSISLAGFFEVSANPAAMPAA